MIIQDGGWIAAVETGQIDVRSLEGSVRAVSRSVIDAPTAMAGAEIEILNRLGGMWIRARIAGSLIPGSVDQLQIEVVDTGEIWEELKTLPSLIDTSLMASGMPSDLAAAVLDEIMEQAGTHPSHPGILQVYSGGYHMVDSSGKASRYAAQLLYAVLQVLASGRDLVEGDVTPVLSSWRFPGTPFAPTL